MHLTKKPSGDLPPRSATRCRVDDCLAEPFKALTRPRVPPRVSYGGVLSWCIHAGAKPSGQCTESRASGRGGNREATALLEASNWVRARVPGDMVNISELRKRRKGEQAKGG